MSEGNKNRIERVIDYFDNHLEVQKRDLNTLLFPVLENELDSIISILIRKEKIKKVTDGVFSKATKPLAKVSISDELFQEARIYCNQKNIPLKNFVEDAIEERLTTPVKQSKAVVIKAKKSKKITSRVTPKGNAIPKMLNIKRPNTIKENVVFALFDSGKNGINIQTIANNFNYNKNSVSGRLSELRALGFAKKYNEKYFLIPENNETKKIQEELVFNKIRYYDKPIKAKTLVHFTAIKKDFIISYCDSLVEQGKAIKVGKEKYVVKEQFKDLNAGNKIITRQRKPIKSKPVEKKTFWRWLFGRH